eukprot:Nitzschia sp. Nitz4//scaffold62_size106224//66051//68669//NITZ4_004361-RA/size106224-processed-gene-0.56-mRNA-1//-1//CDS//3329555871//6832//frame0
MSDGNGGASGGGPKFTPSASGQALGGQPMQGRLSMGMGMGMGGMNRRSSLGMAEAALGDLFGRRASGFGDMDVFGRRGSLDSTSAVLDAAIMDLTRRRLSMAMGGMPADAPASGMPMGIPDSFSFTTPGAFGMDSTGLSGGGFTASPATSKNVISGSNTGLHDSNNSNQNNSHKQLQEQQRDLERRQQELEAQRQKLMAAMEERRKVMQQMQQSMGQMGPGNGMGNGLSQRNSLLGSLGGALGGGAAGASQLLFPGMGGGMGGSMGGRMGAPAPSATGNTNNNNSSNNTSSNNNSNNNTESEWIVCKICNSKAFANREEAAQHEALCMALDTGRRSSLGFGGRRASIGAGTSRRSSLDMLMGLTPTGRRDSMSWATAGLGGLDPFFPMNNMPNMSNMNGMSAMNMNMNANTNSNTNSEPAAPPPMDHGVPNTMSNGPFAMLEKPTPLAMEPDKDWLTPLHCFVRSECVQVFTATEQDVATPSKGKRKPIQVGQVGIRCPHCHHEESGARERGSVYYPTSISSIYNATMNLLQRHLHNCTSVPPEIMQRYESLKSDDARSGTSKKYWVESALSLGLVDTVNGIRYSALTPPPLPSSKEVPPIVKVRQQQKGYTSGADVKGDISKQSNMSMPDGMGASSPNMGVNNNTMPLAGMGNQPGNNASGDGDGLQDDGLGNGMGTALVADDDKHYATAFSFYLLSQMQPCAFTEADRLGKRKGLPTGFPGLACRHCFGGYGSGRFFPSSIKTLSDTSKTLNVLHNHMMRCRKCPPEIRDLLANHRKQHDEQRAKMKFGSQKAFFARIWDRLHKKDKNVTAKRKIKPQDVPNQMQASMQANNNNNNFGPQGAFFDPTMQFDAALAMQQYGDLLNKRQKLG